MPVVHSFGRDATSPNVSVIGIDNAVYGRMTVRDLIGEDYEKFDLQVSSAPIVLIEGNPTKRRRR